jgi:uncharacterized protein (UPF0254 family)
MGVSQQQSQSNFVMNDKIKSQIQSQASVAVPMVSGTNHVQPEKHDPTEPRVEFTKSNIYSEI